MKAKKSENKRKKIEEILIKVGIEIARKGGGALFIISDSCKYKRLLKQKIKPFSIFEKGAEKILMSIGTIDGAVIVNSKGMIKDYGAFIKSKKIFKGFGTRHIAAYNASLNKDTIAILVSEEEKKVKIFKEGKIILQFDTLEKNIQKNVNETFKLLESLGFGTLSSVSISTLIPGLGVSIFPGIILFAAPYYIFRKIQEKRKTKKF
ncbi:MAG: DNA integrity scanning protein DisA nucleotide-binding domain protein [Candidatus Pacearchaeota archaeon]